MIWYCQLGKENCAKNLPSLQVRDQLIIISSDSFAAIHYEYQTICCSYQLVLCLLMLPPLDHYDFVVVITSLSTDCHFIINISHPILGRILHHIFSANNTLIAVM